MVAAAAAWVEWIIDPLKNQENRGDANAAGSNSSRVFS
jgi:hypothetical protein